MKSKESVIILAIMLFSLVIQSCENSIVNSDGTITIKLMNNNLASLESKDKSLKVDFQQKEIKINNEKFTDKDNDGFIDIDKPLEYNKNNLKVKADKNKFIIKSNNKVVLFQTDNKSLIEANNKIEDEEKESLQQESQIDLEKILVINEDLDNDLDKLYVKSQNITISYSKEKKKEKQYEETKEIAIVDNNLKSWLKIKKNNTVIALYVDFNGNNKPELIINVDNNGNVKGIQLKAIELTKVFGTDILTIAKKYLETKDASVLNDAERILKEKYPDKYKIIEHIKAHPEEFSKIINYNYSKLLEEINRIILEKAESENKEEEKEQLKEENIMKEEEKTNEEQTKEENNEEKESEKNKNLEGNKPKNQEQNKEIQEEMNNSTTTSENKTKILEKIDPNLEKCENTVKEYYKRLVDKKPVKDLFDSETVDIESVEKLHNALYDAITYESINVKDMNCAKYNEVLYTCKYKIVSKFKDKENNSITREVNYSTFLNDDCKIINTIEI